MNIADLRTDYRRQTLDESTVAADPFRQFEQWLQEAIEGELPEPTAMTLATAGGSGRPSARIVLLKGFDSSGFVFYTNYGSRKARELLRQPWAALLFHWIELERQVRIEGAARPIPAEESDAYFASRPLASRIGAWASPQSDVIPDREFLDARVSEVHTRFGEAVPRPPHWGGFRLVPEAMEFWQGRPSRLHDRIRYSRAGADLDWTLERLAP